VTTIAPPRVVRLDPVLHGLIGPAGGTRDLDAMLAQARAAEAGGAGAVTIPAGSGPGGRQWPGTAQALAVLLATSTVRVVVDVSAEAWAADALARFAASATGLAGERLAVRVLGPGATTLAAALSARWAGPVATGDTELAALAAA
jgi:hypothetical protein